MRQRLTNGIKSRAVEALEDRFAFYCDSVCPLMSLESGSWAGWQEARGGGGGVVEGVARSSREVLQVVGRDNLAPTQGEFAGFAGLMGAPTGGGTQFVRKVLPIPSADLRAGDILEFDMFMQSGDGGTAEDLVEVRVNNGSEEPLHGRAGGVDTGWQRKSIVVTQDLLAGEELRLALLVRKGGDGAYRVLGGIDNIRVIRPPAVTVSTPLYRMDESNLATVTGTFNYDFEDRFVNLSASTGDLVIDELARTFRWSKFYPNGESEDVVTISAADSDGLSAAATFVVKVDNQVPRIEGDLSPMTVNEGDSLSREFRVTDAPGDMPTLAASIGQLADLGDGRYRWEYLAGNGASSESLVLTATDRDRAITVRTIPITIQNTVPRIQWDERGAVDGDDPLICWAVTDDFDSLDNVQLNATLDEMPVVTGRLVPPSDCLKTNSFGVGEFTVSINATDDAGTTAESRSLTVEDDDKDAPAIDTSSVPREVRPEDSLAFQWSITDPSGVDAYVAVYRGLERMYVSDSPIGEIDLVQMIRGKGVGEYWISTVATDQDSDRIGDNLTTSELPLEFRLESVAGDVTGDGVIDVADVDYLCRSLNAQDFERAFDLDGSGEIGFTDVDFLLERIMNTVVGDVNYDRIFDSSDLIEIFQKGLYADAVEDNAVWSLGDWNCDGEFDSSDLILAFQRGGYRS